MCDLLAIYRIVKNVEVPDREDLQNWNMRDTRRHGRKLKTVVLEEI